MNDEKLNSDKNNDTWLALLSDKNNDTWLALLSDKNNDTWLALLWFIAKPFDESYIKSVFTNHFYYGVL